MTTPKPRLLALLKLFHGLKETHLRWLSDNQAQHAQLKQAQALAVKSLEAELQLKSVQLAHQISMLRTQNATELAMFKTKCKQDLKDYQQYLASLEQLKHTIKSSYTHLPEAVAFTIHHHAKQLLNEMWEADTVEQKMRHELRLIQFMTTVHEDARLHKEGATSEHLPEKTLHLIQHV